MGRHALSGLRTGIVAVGRLSNKHCRSLCDEYAAMLSRYISFSMHEAREGNGRDRVAKAAEAPHLLKHLPTSCYAVALDERGTSLTSTAFASWLTEKRERGIKDVRFVVGGSFGLDPSVMQRCDESIRLSDMTLPYPLARVLLLEQLYRGVTLAVGAPYHIH